MAKYVGVCVKIMSIVVFIIALALMLVDYFQAFSFNIPFIWMVLALGCAAASFVFQIALGQLQVREMPFKYGLLQLTLAMTNFIFSIGLVVYLTRGEEGRIEAIAAAWLLISVASVITLRRMRLLNFSGGFELYRDALKFGVPLLPHAVGGLLFVLADRYIVNMFLSLEKLGVYILAVQVASLFGLTFSAINSAFVPWLFDKLKSNDGKTNKQIVKFTYVYFAVIFLGGVLASGIAPFFLEVYVGSEYWEAKEFIGFLIIGQVFLGMYFMVVNYLLYAKDTGVLSAITISVGLDRYS